MNPFLRYLADKNSAHRQTHRHTDTRRWPQDLAAYGAQVTIVYIQERICVMPVAIGYITQCFWDKYTHCLLCRGSSSAVWRNQTITVVWTAASVDLIVQSALAVKHAASNAVSMSACHWKVCFSACWSVHFSVLMAFCLSWLQVCAFLSVVITAFSLLRLRYWKEEIRRPDNT